MHSIRFNYFDSGSCNGRLYCTLSYWLRRRCYHITAVTTNSSTVVADTHCYRKRLMGVRYDTYLTFVLADFVSSCHLPRPSRCSPLKFQSHLLKGTTMINTVSNYNISFDRSVSLTHSNGYSQRQQDRISVHDDEFVLLKTHS